MSRALLLARAAELPCWLLPSNGSLGTLQVSHVLLHGYTAQREIRQLYDRYSTADDGMDFVDWVAFNEAEQGGGDPSALREAFVRACASDSNQLCYMRFAMLLLSLENRAVPPGVYTADLSRPLAHYWVATSHNSYIVGDQLTGRSTREAYQRQLLQGCRHVEIDCWDRRRLPSYAKAPVVTHGHTFCTTDTFVVVVSAIAESAFVTSDLPVILSLEMHCGKKGQRQIAEMLVAAFGDRLLSYSQLEAMIGAMPSSGISVEALRGRVLCKGKDKDMVEEVKRRRKEEPGDIVQRSGRSIDSLDSNADGDAPTRAGEKMDPQFLRHVAIRTVPAKDFLGDKSGEYGFALPISSIGEELLEEAAGVAAPSTTNAGDYGESARLCDREYRATQGIHAMQRKTAAHLVRAFPLGPRFSGMNMDPLRCWRTGAQHVALNLCNTVPDLPAQLHYALFEDTGGYVLKPEAMVNGQGWPPRRESLRRVTIDLLSLHGLPLRGEERPRIEGAHGASHAYASELSGCWRPPRAVEASSPRVHVSLHTIGGFCSVGTELPPSPRVKTEHMTSAAEGGLSACFGETVHLLAAEPHETILRVAVLDGEASTEVAFETAVLGRLRQGYRTLQLRSRRGTRIEMCHLLVRISLGEEPHRWQSASELRKGNADLRSENEELRGEVGELRKRLRPCAAAP
ncbi:hypothetical protein EMIHUDRAFT_116213 [Emiliania huxleyi CCMP1516]|uniref:Phosphoinositide phospholipase C n=2 Tax=Emiliania huxleyi TaxID=2903 RepID=A0A0D3JJR9_EMIH1|nr:hypothetical protein EMIHUDRAFT_116213 [Emiliania huxleyi CCMP1516]EOD23754.1 hypothetical protein EMIHUDRAFT_116213 [Emiliania huxleyi CCMP1516]|eukprot:XP_005776183.1 hypothetical protein EMIHUDRAFT_116213 [Emiliania huxleyi CCMP1516]